MDLELVLRRAVELGASDIHLKVERPPIVRRDGDAPVAALAWNAKGWMLAFALQNGDAGLVDL